MLSTYKLLILDDHALCCEHTRSLLMEAGITDVHIAYNGADALEKLRSHDFQLVITDLKMPDMDGLQFINELNRWGLHPMLAISTSCSRRLMNSVSLMAKESGFSVIGMFQKPFSPEHVQTLVGQLKIFRADAQEERESRGRVPIFEKSTLVRALSDMEIQGWFQPKKSLQTGHIIGVEVLARWNHPEFGFMMPRSFLSAMQFHQLDRELLMRMMDDACFAHLSWRKQGYLIPVSVNLPISLLDDIELPDELHAIVMRNGISTAQITFELLEDEKIGIPANYYMSVSRLRLKGFGLAQDDFGRGYSSMYGLISTPFTELKIDRAFVSGAANDDVRSATLALSVQLGRQLGLLVTAEGVESTQDLELLRRIGCDCVQGYLISAAVPKQDLALMLAGEPRNFDIAARKTL
ncbi:Oxygen sensor protein DosP [Delftia tsuruhatensis]|uniref:EAL domain-containing response regulator n=1 Tax=Delftia tsuruhatensis TaxID=180282 RepID=UPI001E720BDB|nr:EAL domain-containing response regulator [Delftia tsuruhatensis]CAB5703588.1 Oxygen sensor protein DosP [Delftia tsuruhatensis]CAC9684390.1 Oxygen sensor protein DosP [Delftia tsuruhatensis]